MMDIRQKCFKKQRQDLGVHRCFWVFWVCVRGMLSLPLEKHHMRGKLLWHRLGEDRHIKRMNCDFKPRCQPSNQTGVTALQCHPRDFLIGGSDAITNAVTYLDTHTSCELGMSIISLSRGGWRSLSGLPKVLWCVAETVNYNPSLY